MNKTKKHHHIFVYLIIILILLILLILGLPSIISKIFAEQRLYEIDNAPSRSIAIVFGAGLQRDGSPTAVLKDRVTTAAELYLSGKVKKIMMSGDNRTINYNEPASMRRYAIFLGIPEEDIILDYAGRRTFDTCYRAKYIFAIDNAILVTQKFHQPRALLTCAQFDIDAIGVAADRRSYQKYAMRFWKTREVFATLMAFWNLYIGHPLPVLGQPQPINFDA